MSQRLSLRKSVNAPPSAEQQAAMPRLSKLNQLQYQAQAVGFLNAFWA
jgi:hypothetical protein